MLAVVMVVDHGAQRRGPGSRSSWAIDPAVDPADAPADEPVGEPVGELARPAFYAEAAH